MIIRAPRQNTGKGEATVKIEIEIAAIFGAYHQPREDADAFACLCALRPVKLLIHKGIDAIGTAISRDNIEAIRGIGNRRFPANSQIEASNIMPCPQLVDACETCVLFALIEAVLHLAHKKR